MSEQQSSYSQIMKATSLFGGVQVFNILITIIRSKFIAVLLGTTGMGISGLLTATTGLITGMTNFGLSTSAVKNVAAANATGNQTRVAIIIKVLRRWVLVTGLLGMILTIVTAPFLSRLTFGNTDYTFSFIWVSVSLLFAQLSSGQMILLQGMRRLQALAKANLAGSILGLIFTVPLYYFCGIKGIVPAIILTSVVTLAGSWYFARKIEIPKVDVTKIRTFAEGKEMLTMGFMISLSGLIALGSSYIVRIFISSHGDVDQVGLYNAGFTIINTYVGLIFSAMATDYYPRLAAVSKSNEECRIVINQQTKIALLIISPIIISFLVFIKWIILILYSSKFVPVNEMILWAALGMLFKAITWAMGFILLAKGTSNVFFMSELASNIYILIFNLLGYHFFGLTGLGISFLIGYVLSMIQVFIIAKIKFEFKFQKDTYSIFFKQFTLCLSSFLIAVLIGGKASYIIGTILFLTSLLYSFNELDKRMGLKAIALGIKDRFIKK
jgi:O-antigen/teichoic acid export membrane protein